MKQFHSLTGATSREQGKEDEAATTANGFGGGLDRSRGGRGAALSMGAITGKPDEQTVNETLEAYKAVGVDQYLIVP